MVTEDNRSRNMIVKNAEMTRANRSANLVEGNLVTKVNGLGAQNSFNELTITKK